MIYLYEQLMTDHIKFKKNKSSSVLWEETL